jgi:hypothetical protein
MTPFEQQRADWREIRAIGESLALAAFDHGDRLTADQRQALTHWSRFGSDGYPIVRCGRKWLVEHRAATRLPLYPTKAAAVRAWEILIATWIRLSGLEARDRALAAISASARVGRCELCGEPAGDGGALCPACAASR